MNQNIISAIDQKLVLKLHYKNFDRLVEPHIYGVDQEGAERLLCFQTACGSSSGAQPDWKLLNVAEIVALEVTRVRFYGTRPGYKIDDCSISHVHAQVQQRGLADWRG